MSIPIVRDAWGTFPQVPGTSDVCPIPKRIGKSFNPITVKSTVETGLKKNIIGLFPIHNKDCHTILTTKNYNGIQRAMAMIHALNIVNEEVKNGTKRVALNGYLYDTCSNEISAIDSLLEAMGNHDPVSALIGASYSSVSVPVSMLAQAYNMSMLSYASTSGSLSDKQKHSTFARLLPSDTNQARVVFDLVKHLNWTVVQVLLTRDKDYSKSLNEEFQRLVATELHQNIQICKVTEFFFVNSTEEIEHDRREINSLIQSGVDGVVSFMTADSKYIFLDGLESALADLTLVTKPFPIVSTDSWDVGQITKVDAAQFLAGNSFVALPFPSDPSELRYGANFTEFLTSLNRWRYPWLQEMWENMCNENDQDCLDSQLDLATFRIDSKVSFVIDTVMAISNAFERCHANGCNERTQMFFQDYVLTTNFQEGQDDIKFDCQGNGYGKYGIYELNFQDNRGQYERIGVWNDMAFPKLTFNQEDQFSDSGNQTKHWACRPPCTPEEYEEEHSEISSCCHNCTLIPTKYIKINPRAIKVCPDGTWPNLAKSQCDDLPQETLRMNKGWSIMALLTAILGMAVLVAVAVVNGKNYDHEKIKSSSRELSIFIGMGAFISHFHTFLVFFTTPSPASCSFIRFTLTLGYTCMLAALFLKVHRIFRIFYGQFNQANDILGKPKYVSPKHQVVFASILVLIQVVIVIIWIIADPPCSTQLFPKERHVLVCEVNVIFFFWVQIYNVGLCCIGTFYSILTRDVPENFNESRWINVTMYSVCFIWLMQVSIWAQRVNIHDVDKHFAYNPEVRSVL
eukprot:snap_masked-scaffold1132_size60346-processed-gene-0.1 protein:Tk12388 transcript:snap_masked-scaffold1132_size60346-processed-gene-0.1-mRNA-1 annotation:"GI14041"